MADRVTDSTASIRRGLNQHGCERIVLPSHIRVQSTKLTDISFVAYTDGLCPLCMVYQMAKEFATRRYQLTINNPKEHGYDHDTIKAILAKGAKLLYWCMCDEEGKEETYHTHLYLVFYNAVMFKTLKNKFPTAHIEVPQWGTNSENYAYIRKEGTKYHKDANGHYEYTDAQGKVHVGTNFSDTFEESGDLPPDAKQGDRNDLRMLYKLIASGEDNAQILGEHPEYLRDISHIDRTRQTILEEKYRNVFRRMNVTYISGPTGVGKTRSVREGCGYANCYSVSDYKHPFDGYRGQAAILFDEFHNSLPLVNTSYALALHGLEWLRSYHQRPELNTRGMLEDSPLPAFTDGELRDFIRATAGMECHEIPLYPETITTPLLRRLVEQEGAGISQLARLTGLARGDIRRRLL